MREVCEITCFHKLVTLFQNIVLRKGVKIISEAGDINIFNLPTSDKDLEVGALYVKKGTLKIKEAKPPKKEEK